ncbi:hypothetical protein ACFU5O_30790 [Streptomyces sp. NPDC057445]|uniref:hypothetical protein n=1 Tax=Streptomyces sp. NPDC057445 TaxID=3346136 RepID=UPI00368E5DCD
MSTGMVTILVAAVGVMGTLLAPITTAWVGARGRLQEFELQQRAETARRRDEDAQQELERRRDTYVALNASARRWRIRMMEDLHALRLGTTPDANGATEAARNEFLDTYAQAQMLVPDSVLKPSQSVRVALADAKKQIDSFREDTAQSPDQWQELHTGLIKSWDVIMVMQIAMRRDLGITTIPSS